MDIKDHQYFLYNVAILNERELTFSQKTKAFGFLLFAIIRHLQKYVYISLTPNFGFKRVAYFALPTLTGLEMYVSVVGGHHTTSPPFPTLGSPPLALAAVDYMGSLQDGFHKCSARVICPRLAFPPFIATRVFVPFSPYS